MIGIALILLIGMFQGATQQTKDENFIINMDNAIEFQGQFADSLQRVADSINKECVAKDSVIYILKKALEAKDYQLDYCAEKSKAYERLISRKEAMQGGTILTVLIVFVLVIFKLMAGG